VRSGHRSRVGYSVAACDPAIPEIQFSLDEHKANFIFPFRLLVGDLLPHSISSIKCTEAFRVLRG
jgi:hypothetical protein